MLFTNLLVIASPSKTYFDKWMFNVSFREELKTLKEKGGRRIFAVVTIFAFDLSQQCSVLKRLINHLNKGIEKT